MKILSLGKLQTNKEENKFGDKGCKGLSRGVWPKMELVFLSFKFFTKIGMKWGRREWHTYRKHSGIVYRIFPSVLK